MNCTSCGCVLQTTDSFCPACGKSAQAPAPAMAVNYGRGLSPAAETSGKATVSLVCGIFFFILPLAIAAIVMGHIALSEIKRSAGRLVGQGRAIAGLVLGYLGIAGIPVILIVAAIAIPNLLRARISANEASAMAGIRAVNSAEVSYAAQYPQIGFTCDLRKLSGSGPESMSLIDPRLASGIKYGYRFSLAGCGTAQSGDVPVPPASDSSAPVIEGSIQRYQVMAVPLQPGTTGQRVFCSDQSGTIHSVRARSGEDCFAGDPLP